MAEKNPGFAVKFADQMAELKIVTAQEAEDLKEGFAKSGRDNFIDFLLEEGIIDKEDILEALSEYYEVPSFDTDGHFFDHLLVRDFPKDFLMRHEIIPLEIDQTILVVIAANPADSNLAVAIGKIAPYEIEFYVGIAQDIQNAIRDFYDKSLTEDDPDLENDPAYEEEERAELDELESENLEE